MKVLLVEDNPGDVRLIREMLAEAGGHAFELLGATTLKEGLECLTRGCDAVLLDLGLPDSRGLDTLRGVVSTYPRVPVVVLTGLRDREMGLAAVREGAQDYLFKERVDGELLSRSLAYAVERKRYEEALHESEARYRFLFNMGNDTLFIHSVSPRGMPGRFVEVNDIACERLGYTREELLQLSPADIEDPEDPAMILEMMRTLLEEKKVLYETVYLARDGKRIPVEVNSHLFEFEGVPAVYSVARDITERKRVQERMERLTGCFLKLGPDVIENMETIVRAGSEILEATCTGYGRLQRGTFSCLSDLPGEEGLIITDTPNIYMCYRIITAAVRKAVVYEDLRGLPHAREDPVIRAHGFLSCLVYPVIMGEQVIGCLCVFDRVVRRFSSEEVEIAGLLARMLVIEEERLAREEGLKDFIDIASHELRHPITIMKGYAVTLRQMWDRLDEGTRVQVLNSIEAGADRLNKLGKELLDVSRIERGRFTVEAKELDLTPLLAQAVGEMEARGTGNAFTIHLPERAYLILAEKEKMHQLLVVLLENAVKYSPPGSPVEVWIEEEGDEVVVAVMDRGPGIQEEHLDIIFERFGQVDDALHHSAPGMGMGLYIARQIAEGHGGRIWYEPRDGGGSVFRFSVKAREAGEKIR
ncbi:MAG: ATP-binding protein [Actinomycetota bacterium]